MNKFYIILFLIICSCSTSKYKVGDCIGLSAMEIDKDNEWTSAGYSMGDFQVIGFLNSQKPNKYMNKRLHADYFYIVKVINTNNENVNPYILNTQFIIPVKDLDNYHYALQFWELPENKKYNCNIPKDN